MNVQLQRLESNVSNTNKLSSLAPQKKKEKRKNGAASSLKLDNCQPAKRKRRVTAAVRSSAAQSYDESLVLRADRKPSRRVNGRLEFALGTIIEELKASNSRYENLFKQRHALDAMKETVRERIRTTMMDKVVPRDVKQIIAAYKQLFPSENDDDVIMEGKLARKKRKIITIKKVKPINPEKFFKKNICELMVVKMKEIMRKLHVICSSVPVTTRHSRLRHQIAQSNQKIQPKLHTEGSSKDTNKTETDETQTQDSIRLETETKAQAPEMKAKDDSQTDPTKAVEEVPGISEFSEPQPALEIIEPTATEAASTLVIPEELINNDHFKALDRLMSYKILHLLKMHIPELVKQMDVSTMYQETKASVMAGMVQEVEQNCESEVPSKEEVSVSHAAVTENTQANITHEKSRLPPLYYVKILGKPSLPTREAMEAFFNQFKPKTIKKHKTLHNLLFVGFVDKESYENMIAADGTAIEQFTLDIKGLKT